ncbi:MAG TPA: SH3 domain-containing protein [Phototrophicaceae bacterium]|nr:SH3 domain-containing protein [Phototrophicaceae bacterium]
MRQWRVFWGSIGLLLLSACLPATPTPPTLISVTVPSITAAPHSTPVPQAPAAPRLPAILFESDRSGRYEIYAVNAQGRDLVRVTDSADTSADGSGSPTWTPDGLGITYSSRRNNDWDLYLLHDGAETDLTHTSGEDDKADWSPDGSQVAFSSVRNSLRWADIFIMDADGSHLRDLTADQDDDREPAWSPNGQEIAYRSFRDGNYEIYVLDLASRAPLQLTRTDPPTWNASPAWSPDGHWIAFETNRDGNYEIYLMDNNGEHLRNLTQNPGDDKEPAWSPDGTQIVFSSNRDGNFELYTISVTSGITTRLTYDCGADHNPAWRRGADQDGAVVPEAVAYVTHDLNLHGSPNANSSNVATAAAKDCLTVIGRSSDGQWLQVRNAQQKAAWVARSLVDVQGDLDSVPVSS